MLGRRADWFVSEKVTKATISLISFKISWINAGEFSPAFLQDML